MAFLLRGYIQLLQKYTLPTQMATGALTSGAGDVIFQQAIERKGWDKHEWYKTQRLMFYGGVIFAPIGNRWHFVLSKINVGGKWKTVGARALTDALVFSPACTCLFYISQGAMERRPWTTTPEMQGVGDRIGERLWPTVQKQWAVFGPAQIINLTLMPLYARPPFMNFISIFWSAYLASAQARGEVKPVSLEEQISQDAVKVYE